MSAPRSRGDAAETVRRALAELARYAEGVHELARPAAVIDAALPASLRAVYGEFDGGELFFGALTLVSSTEIRQVGGRARVGELDGDELAVDMDTGAVWRRERDSEEWFEEASSLDRLVLAVASAEGVLYDRDGEFLDGVVDEDGDLTPAATIERERRALKRDREAPAPRWRLARALVRAGEVAAARDELEELVALRPGFSWAWYDLARISESLGELAAARDEAVAAAEAEPDGDHAGLFLAHAARLAGRDGDRAASAALAARALEVEPNLGRRMKDGGEERLAADDLDAAEELAALALVLAPRDLAAADLVARVERARAAQPVADEADERRAGDDADGDDADGGDADAGGDDADDGDDEPDPDATASSLRSRRPARRARPPRGTAR